MLKAVFTRNIYNRKGAERLLYGSRSRGHNVTAYSSIQKPHTTRIQSRSLVTENGALSSTAQKKSFLRRSWDNGSILLTIGWTGVGLVVLDRFLQYMDRRDALSAVKSIAEEASRKHRELHAAHWDAPTLYTCRVKVEYTMGGSHGLPNVKEGQIVDVLEENVGTGDFYHLCRITNTDNNAEGDEADKVSIGWYPIAFLEKPSEDQKQPGKA